MNDLERIIWIYWDSGWEDAPEITIKCYDSWVSNNTGWTIKKLCRDTLKNYINIENDYPWIYSKNITPTSQSDIIRILLLERYGGIWVDSTLFCRRPLDSWYLSILNKNDFFAFAQPKPDKMVSSWFLAAKKNSYIVKKWRESVFEYWSKRNAADNYFWFHFLFNKLHYDDQKFKNSWDNTVKVSAIAPHYFIPYENSFFQVADTEKINSIKSVQTPVFKLTYKYDQTQQTKGKVIEHILTDTLKMSNPKILVTWYGSFLKNGTVGDYLSVSTLTNYLEEKGFSFDCASYKNFDNLKGNHVDLENISPDNYNVLIFCCGPIMKNHAKLNNLFAKFNHAHKIGIGVSLFKKDHFNHYNPFDFVLARENGEKDYEDIAVLANNYVDKKSKPTHKKLRIGVVLRKQQSEYGSENCKSDLSYSYITRLVDELTGVKITFSEKIVHFFKKPVAKKNEAIVEIDNHLETSGLTPLQIEAEYKNCDLILTTRFHGTMIALRNGIPVIAIDQIKNGAKVYRMISQTGYPFVWIVNRLSGDVLRKSAEELLNHKHDDKIMAAKQKAEEGARFTLDQLYAHLISFKFSNKQNSKHDS